MFIPSNPLTSPRLWRNFLPALLSFCLFLPQFSHANEDLLEIGVAKTDITPGYPIRLGGYAVRKAESEGIDQRLWAKALAIGSDDAGVSVFLTVDSIGVPADVTEAVYTELAATVPLQRENFVVASSHTHSAPLLRNVLPLLFGEDIPAEHQERIDRYTDELIEQLQEVAFAALADRRAATLSRGEGQATFAANRRTPGGPVDHALPVLAVHSPEGSLRAVLANYACHCTTISPDINKHHGDWAGHAQEFIEEDHPGSIAMISIGAGADSNPEPRREAGLAQQHGREIADEVRHLLDGSLTPITQAPDGRIESVELSFDTLPTREEFEARASERTYVGYHARKNLERIDRGETLPISLPYEVQAWHFGDELAMVFLPGEVVVDYALRLKEEFDRLWVTAYANDVPAYIPSERVLAEGGYEAEGSMFFYDKPTRFAPGLEDIVIDAVYKTVPETFLSESRNDPPPVSPGDSRD